MVAYIETFKSTVFLSTPSARRATGAFHLKPGTVERFLSTPSARRATAGYDPEAALDI